MTDPGRVTTLVVAASILVLAAGLVGGGLILAVRGGRLLLGVAGVALGVLVAGAALLFTLSPVVARSYDPAGDEDGGEG